MKSKFLSGYKGNFDTLLRAAGAEHLALMDCRRTDTGEQVAVVCAVNITLDDRGERQFDFVPLAAMISGNPYEQLDPPNPDGGYFDGAEITSDVTREQAAALTEQAGKPWVDTGCDCVNCRVKRNTKSAIVSQAGKGIPQDMVDVWNEELQKPCLRTEEERKLAVELQNLEQQNKTATDTADHERRSGGGNEHGSNFSIERHAELARWIADHLEDEGYLIADHLASGHVDSIETALNRFNWGGIQ